MKTNLLVAALQKLNKTFYTVSDIEMITRQPRAQVRVALTRLVKRGDLVRLFKNYYVLKDQVIDAERIAEQLDATSYLSFESAMARWGVINQLPYTVTLATAKKSKRFNFGDAAVVYRRIKPELLGGYVLENGLRVATPEKALLDVLYLISRGKMQQSLEEVDTRTINKKIALTLAEKFPAKVKEMLKMLFEQLK